MTTPDRLSIDERIEVLREAVDAELTGELRATLRTLRAADNPNAVLVSMSRLALRIVRLIYAGADRKPPSDALFDCIEGASRAGVLPGEMATCLHTVRVFSNKVDHGAAQSLLTVVDAENAVALLLRVVEWYACEFPQGPRLGSAYDQGAVRRRRVRRRLAWAAAGLGGAAVVALAVVLLLPVDRSGAAAGGAAPDTTAAVGAEAGDAGGPPPSAAVPSAEPFDRSALGSRPRLLVAPFAAESERAADRRLWPLFDRILVNALEPDDRFFGRLERVDPQRVADERGRRELPLPLRPEHVTELALALDADLVLSGAVTRAEGRVRVAAELRAMKGAGRGTLLAEGVDVLAAASGVGSAFRAALWGDTPSPPTPAALAGVLIAYPETAEGLLALSPAQSSAEQRALYDALLERDGVSVGVAWLRLLEDPKRRAAWDEVARRGAALGDAELRAFFTGLTARPPCAGVDPARVGERLPHLLGPLAVAVCHLRARAYGPALAAATAAHRSPDLRPQARRLTTLLLDYAADPREQCRRRRQLQELEPALVEGWSALAFCLARAGQHDAALEPLGVAHSLLRTDARERYLVGYHGAQLHIEALDVRAAAEWVELMERNAPTDEPDPDGFLFEALYAALRGDLRAARAFAERGMDALPDRADNVWTQLAASRFYLLLAEGLLDEAEQVVGAYAARFQDKESPGDHYGVEVLRLVLAAARGGLTHEAAVARMEALGAEVVAQTADEGRVERAAHECLFLSHSGDRERAKAVVTRDGTLRVIGGCRLRYAEILAAEGNHAAAAAEFEEALRDIVGLRFGYLDLIPAAMLGRARSLEAIGDRTAARAAWRRVVDNLGPAGRQPDAVVAAHEALARLGPADVAPPAPPR